MPRTHFASPTLRQSLGLVDRPCTESELLQYLIEGEAARQELDQQARELIALAEHATPAARPPEGDFLDRMTQEMRAPLNGIIGMTENMRSKHLPESLHDSVDAIRQSGDALLAIVDDILDFSKIESGRLRLERADFEIAPMLAQSIQILRNAASRKFLTIRTYLDPALPAVISGDVVRVRQILLTLLGNAIKFTFEGEIELRAELRASTRKGLEIYFSVKDNGIGIMPHQQVRLFQPFSHATDPVAKSFSGSGLGLALSKSLAELMGGAIGVTSKQGSGSLFWFTILVQQAKQVSRYAVRAPVNDDTAKVPAAEQRNLVKPFRLLVVEDNSVNRKVALLLLAKLGYMADIAKNGAEALAAIAATRYDLVLIDCHMPGMDGFETARRLRSAAGYTTTIPILAMTANAQSKDRKACTAAGMSDCLSKPLREMELAGKLERWLTA